MVFFISMDDLTTLNRLQNANRNGRYFRMPSLHINHLIVLLVVFIPNLFENKMELTQPMRLCIFNKNFAIAFLFLSIEKSLILKSRLGLIETLKSTYILYIGMSWQPR